MIPELVQSSNNLTPIAGFGLTPNHAASVPTTGEVTGLGLGTNPGGSLVDGNVTHFYR